MLEMGRTLSQQLAEVEQHAKLLLELKTEYDSVLSHTNQDIANLSSRKVVCLCSLEPNQLIVETAT